MSDTLEGGEERIPTVIVQFHEYPDLWMPIEMYNIMGKFKGLLQTHLFSIKDIKKVHKPLKHPSSYPTKEWEP